MLASIEYGVCVLGVPLVVVLGHDSCGAVRAAVDAATEVAPATSGLRPIIDRIAPSLPADVAAADLDAVSADHVRRTVEQIARAGAPASRTTPASSGIAQAVRSGACGVVGLTYRLAEGRVSVIATSGTG